MNKILACATLVVATPLAAFGAWFGLLWSSAKVKDFAAALGASDHGQGFVWFASFITLGIALGISIAFICFALEENERRKKSG